MEAFTLYLLKSVAWLTGFLLVFILFLRNERFFMLNRIYLLAGILTSFLLPFVSIHYTVVLPVITSVQSDSPVISEVQNTTGSIIPDLKLVLSAIYVSGVLFVFTLIIRQGRTVFRAIKKSEIITQYPAKLIRTADCTSAYSFFSYVFVNPSISDIEAREIMNHELVHIRQKHWFDLVLVELLCMMQWFNPLIWIYVRFMRQNHEYLADEVALQRTSDPAIYRAALLNQIVGSPVVSLSNSFNYSLNKKRFNMMKNIIRSPYRKMKILLILPVFAVLLYSFAKPDYKYKIEDKNSGNLIPSPYQIQHEVKGIVVQKGGEALPGAIITLRNSTTGTITDASGAFKIGNIPDDGELVVSFAGFKAKVIKPDFKTPMRIEMVKDTVKYTDLKIDTPPPPPPPPPITASATDYKFIIDGQPPLFIVDGKVTSKADFDKLDPKSFESITVLKDNSDNKNASVKYGEKGKNGVIEVTSKKVFKGTPNQLPRVPPPPPPPPSEVKDGEKPFVVVESMPEFPGGGKDAMIAWISANLKYPGEAYKEKITGKVLVDFTVSKTGKVKNVTISKSVHPLLDAEAKRVISTMPDWKPATQGGKAVDVQYKVPVEFKLK